MGSYNSSSKNGDEFNNQTESSGLNKINSKYIIIKILENLNTVRALQIIKYNKKIIGKLNLDKNYFKDFSETKTTIEIGLILFKKKYGTFINYSDENISSYFHIFFNDIDVDRKRNYLNKNEQVENIKIKIDYFLESFSHLFENCTCIKSINFIKFHRTNVKDMNHMFSGCYSLKEINFLNFNTNNVTNMSNMFSLCSSLKTINLQNFKTDNVTNMSCMFSGCSDLEELDVKKLSTNNVTNMSSMFSGCSLLKELDLSNFKTEKVTLMGKMFYQCYKLEEINVSSFDTENVTDMSYMFSGCTSLMKLNLSNFKSDNVKNKSFMFSRCSSLIEINISKSKFYISSYDITTCKMFNRSNKELVEEIEQKYNNLNINNNDF